MRSRAAAQVKGQNSGTPERVSHFGKATPPVGTADPTSRERLQPQRKAAAKRYTLVALTTIVCIMGGYAIKDRNSFTSRCYLECRGRRPSIR
jgi:hypothetical protein